MPRAGKTGVGEAVGLAVAVGVAGAFTAVVGLAAVGAEVIGVALVDVDELGATLGGFIKGGVASGVALEMGAAGGTAVAGGAMMCGVVFPVLDVAESVCATAQIVVETVVNDNARNNLKEQRRGGKNGVKGKGMKESASDKLRKDKYTSSNFLSLFKHFLTRPLPDMSASTEHLSTPERSTPTGFPLYLPWFLALVVGLVLYYSNPAPNDFYDYTWRIAQGLWHGQLGLDKSPGSWLNELVPFNGKFYSVFPLGSVLTMMPLTPLLTYFPGAFLSAFCGAATTWFAFHLASLWGDSLSRRVCFCLVPVLGSWMWCNVAFAGAWQIVLAFAVAGQFGALYFTLVKPRPFLAGAFFALAFGNRTEVILTAPLFLYLMLRAPLAIPVLDEPQDAVPGASPEKNRSNKEVARAQRLQEKRLQEERDREAERDALHKASRKARIVSNTLWFCLTPLVLGVATLLYNNARFGSPTDFGYARIPGVLLEENYKYGIFSLHAIPNNFHKMLLDGWNRRDVFPYWVPSGWGGSLFLSCPFLLLLWGRFFSRDRGMTIASWMGVVALTFVLWIHGDPGGWQYSYRYAMVLLPWLYLILLAQKPSVNKARNSVLEWSLLVLSLAINAWAVHLFYHTPFVKP